MEFHPAANIFPMMDAEAHAALVADIEANGQRESIITYDGMILDGRNRYQALASLGWPANTREWDGVGDPVAFVVSLNLHRRHLSESQRAMVAARIRGLNLDPGGDTAEVAAEAVNVSRASVFKAARVIDQGTPELVAAVDAGRVAVSAADRVAQLPAEDQAEIVARGPKEIMAKARELRQGQREQKKAERTAMHRAVAEGNQALDFGDRRFAVIEADPAWSFGNAGVNGAAEGHYPVMSTAEIAALPVARHALDEAVLFLWVPNALALDDGKAVMAAWGFEYKTNFVWVKPDNVGTGFYNFQDHELLLVGVRGGNMTPVVRFSSVIGAPKGEHSAKPERAYEMIEAMYPDAPRLGLFRREQRAGWEVWGNQADAPETFGQCQHVHAGARSVRCTKLATVRLESGKVVCAGCEAVNYRKERTAV